MTDYSEIIKREAINQASATDVIPSRFVKTGPILRYPLEKEDDYGGTITFRARPMDSISLSGRATDLVRKGLGLQTRSDTVNPSSPNVAEVSTVLEQGSTTRATAITDFNSLYDGTTTPGTAAANGRSDIGGYNQEGRKCVMYLPASIQVQDRVTYSNTDLGIVGAGIRTGLLSGQSGSEIVGGAFSNLASTMGDIGSILFGGNNAIQNEEAAQVAALRMTPGVASGAISSATGVAINPNKRALLSGPEIRSFTFAFRLIPTSAAEAESIERIIQFFREEMYPDVVEQFGINAAFRYPSIFDIILRYKSSDGRYHKVATGILPCFLASLDTNYNQSGMSFHRDGKPQEATLTLVFNEERALNKNDIATRGY